MTDDGTKSFVERKNNMHCYNTLQHSQYEGLFTLISLSSFRLHDYRSDTSIYQKHIFAAKLRIRRLRILTHTMAQGDRVGPLQSD